MKNLLIAISFIMILPQISLADAAWYSGTVSRVALINGGSFIVTFDESTLDDCRNRYAYFRPSQLSDETLKHAYTLALTSITTKMQMGVVIDKAVNGVGGLCYAIGMAADLRSN